MNRIEDIIPHIPPPITAALIKYHCFLAGGFIRAFVAEEETSDVDLFFADLSELERVKLFLEDEFNAKTVSNTKNAVTLRLPDYDKHVQLIKRWMYPTAEELIWSFDFTICQAAVWYERQWRFTTSYWFDIDVFAKYLHYTAPIRNEDGPGSVLRIIRFVEKGYFVDRMSIAGCMARMLVNKPGTREEQQLALDLMRQLESVY